MELDVKNMEQSTGKDGNIITMPRVTSYTSWP